MEKEKQTIRTKRINCYTNFLLKELEIYYLVFLLLNNINMDTRRLMNSTNYILNTLNIVKEKLTGYHPNILVSKQQSENSNSNKDASMDKYQPIERLFVWLQRIIYWHEPVLSLITIISISIMFL